jgi:hypothetical protein
MHRLLFLLVIIFQIGCAQNQSSFKVDGSHGSAQYFETNAVGIASSFYYHQEKMLGKPTKEIVEDYIHSFKNSHTDYVASQKAFGANSRSFEKYEAELSNFLSNPNQKYTFIASLDLRDTYDPAQRGYLLNKEFVATINAQFRGINKTQGYWYAKLKFDQAGWFAPFDPNRYKETELLKRRPATLGLYTFVIKKVELVTENLTKSLVCHTEIVSLTSYASDRYVEFKRNAEHAPFLLPSPDLTFSKL